MGMNEITNLITDIEINIEILNNTDENFKW